MEGESKGFFLKVAGWESGGQILEGGWGFSQIVIIYIISQQYFTPLTYEQTKRCSSTCYCSLKFLAFLLIAF